jgi:hypothetical protein
MALPVFQSSIRELQMLQSQWTGQLNPVLANPTTNLSLLQNVAIKTGVNTINHLLGQTQQGWIVTDINAAVTLYRSQPFNDKTLTLVSSGPATISLAVY